MAPTPALTNPMLATAGEVAVEASLHTGDPGATGAQEVTGGDYARVAVGWLDPDAGTITGDGDLTFLVPALGSGSVTHVGLWSAEGEWLVAAEAAVPQPFPSAGTATVSPLTMDMTTGALAARVSAR